LEAGTLDLKDTWLVVLSACDTGTGQAQAGEGVMGLRRGFMLAGAQNLLMTLWPISDKYAAMVMQDFYEQAMQTKQAPDALATVQRKWLIKLREQYGAVMAARLAGPFVMTYQSAAPNRNN
jgi:CHAT domain-containing protein